MLFSFLTGLARGLSTVVCSAVAWKAAEVLDALFERVRSDDRLGQQLEADALALGHDEAPRAQLAPLPSTSIKVL